MNAWRLAQFTEVRELGAGAQGRVVLARHTGSGSPVAIKYLARGDGDEAAIERLRDEAMMLARVTDAHVVRLFQFVVSAQGAALVMEAVNGISLKEILAEHEAMPPEAALVVLKGSLQGLAAAHAAGVVHRDYKPANVVVEAAGLSKLIDFGIAALTGAGSRAGTPAYMAPEQWEGAPATPATDVYAATCVFFECVTGRRPYAAGDRAALMRQHLLAPVPAEAVPAGLRPLLTRGMAKDPAQRPPGAAEFVTELEMAAAAAYGPDWERRGVRMLAAGAVALAAMFPLGAALVGTAGTVGTVGGATASGGLLGTTAAKVTVAVAATTVVAGAGTGAYVASTGDEPRPAPVFAPVSVKIVTSTRPAGGIAWRNGYATVSGHRDPAVQRRINAALKAVADAGLGRYGRDYGAGTGGDVSAVYSAPTITLHTTKLLSVFHVFGLTPKGTQGNWVKAFVTSNTVTVDLTDGHPLGATEMLRPAALEPAGLAALHARISRTEFGVCLGERSATRFTRAHFLGRQPLVQLSLRPRAVEFHVDVRGIGGDVSEACRIIDAEVPAEQVADLMAPDVLAELRAAAPTPEPTRS